MTPTTSPPSELGAAHGSALAEQRNALAEARLRIIARQKQVEKWSRKDTTDLINANWDGISEGLAQARRIIGAMWDALPVPQPQVVIDHEAHMRRVIEEQNVSRSPLAALTRILEKAETDAMYALRVDSNDTYQRGDVKRRQKWEQRAKDIKAVQAWLAEQTANAPDQRPAE